MASSPALANMTPSPFSHLQPGDRVTRLMGGVVPMPLIVTEVTATLIVCGAWSFDRVTGNEIDEELGWDARESGSRLLTAQESRAGHMGRNEA